MPLRNDFVKAFQEFAVALTPTIGDIETTMRYKLLGKSGLRVSELCLGTMPFGEAWKDWGLATSKDESRKIFDGFAEAGGNFIDTANKYNEGASESLLGGIHCDRPEPLRCRDEVHALHSRRRSQRVRQSPQEYGPRS
jgi:predicted aldo/keto reductase-like oxidoreductase